VKKVAQVRGSIRSGRSAINRRVLDLLLVIFQLSFVIGHAPSEISRPDRGAEQRSSGIRRFSGKYDDAGAALRLIRPTPFVLQKTANKSLNCPLSRKAREGKLQTLFVVPVEIP